MYHSTALLINQGLFAISFSGFHYQKKRCDIYCCHMRISNSSVFFFYWKKIDTINVYSLIYSYAFVCWYVFRTTHIDVIVQLMVSIYNIYWHMSWNSKNTFGRLDSYTWSMIFDLKRFAYNIPACLNTLKWYKNSICKIKPKISWTRTTKFSFQILIIIPFRIHKIFAYSL